MSTEVESSQVDSGLTAASSGGAEEKSQNTSEGTHLQREQAEPGQKGSGDGHSQEATRSPTDMHKKCKENDKENDQSSNADSAVEAVKRKVVEAPPPKVNPWTKRTTGRVPSNNINSQEKGETAFLLLITIIIIIKHQTQLGSSSCCFFFSARCFCLTASLQQNLSNLTCHT